VDYISNHGIDLEIHPDHISILDIDGESKYKNNKNARSAD